MKAAILGGFFVVAVTSMGANAQALGSIQKAQQLQHRNIVKQQQVYVNPSAPARTEYNGAVSRQAVDSRLSKAIVSPGRPSVVPTPVGKPYWVGPSTYKPRTYR